MKKLAVVYHSAHGHTECQPALKAEASSTTASSKCAVRAQPMPENIAPAKTASMRTANASGL